MSCPHTRHPSEAPSQNCDGKVVLQGHQNLQSAPLNKIPDSTCQGLQIPMAWRSEIALTARTMRVPRLWKY